MSEERTLEREIELAEMQVSQEIKNILAKVPTDRMSDEFCECGESIHVERRIRGYTTCIECAIEAEQHNRIYAKVN